MLPSTLTYRGSIPGRRAPFARDHPTAPGERHFFVKVATMSWAASFHQLKAFCLAGDDP